MKKTLVVMSAVFFVVLLSGCGWQERAEQKMGEKIMEKAIESQTGGEVDIQNGGTNISVKTGGETVNLSQDGGIPANFPKDIFVYADAKVKVSLVSDGGKEASITYFTDTKQDTAFLEYRKKMTENGWKLDENISSSLTGGSAGTMGMGMLQFSKDDREVNIIITLNDKADSYPGNEDEKGKTYVSVVSTVKK